MKFERWWEYNMYDVRRFLKDDAHSWAVFLYKDVENTTTNDIITGNKAPIASGLTYEQAIKMSSRMNVNEFFKRKVPYGFSRVVV